MNKYKDLMNNIQLSEESKTRILKNIEITDKNTKIKDSAKKKRKYIYAVGNIAAILVLIGIMIPWKTPTVQRPNSSPVMDRPPLMATIPQKEICIKNIDGQKTVYEEDNQVTEIIELLKNAEKTSKISVQDTPLQKIYFKVSIETGYSPIIFFIYEDNGKWYAEKPYDGIYQIDEKIKNFCNIS